MFGISGEHLLILGIILLFFGPRRLPELGNTMGKAIRNFKDAISGIEEAQYRKLPEETAKSAQPVQPAQPTAAPAAHTVAAEVQPAEHAAPHSDSGENKA